MVELKKYLKIRVKLKLFERKLGFWKLNLKIGILKDYLKMGVLKIKFKNWDCTI